MQLAAFFGVRTFGEILIVFLRLPAATRGAFVYRMLGMTKCMNISHEGTRLTVFFDDFFGCRGDSGNLFLLKNLKGIRIRLFVSESSPRSMPSSTANCTARTSEPYGARTSSITAPLISIQSSSIEQPEDCIDCISNWEEDTSHLQFAEYSHKSGWRLSKSRMYGNRVVVFTSISNFYKTTKFN